MEKWSSAMMRQPSLCAGIVACKLKGKFQEASGHKGETVRNYPPAEHRRQEHFQRAASTRPALQKQFEKSA
jgi:hypothetical protein